MHIIGLRKTSAVKENEHCIMLCGKDTRLSRLGLNKDETEFVRARIKQDKRNIEINRFNRFLWVHVVQKKNPPHKTLETCRNDACALLDRISDLGIKKINIIDCGNEGQPAMAFAEGMALGSYRFLKYLSDKDKKDCSLRSVSIQSENISAKEIKELQEVIRSVFIARDLVNEPLAYLTARKLSSVIRELGKESGFEVEVLHKGRIEALKMGGLLSVNRGSPEPPTFNIMQWKPARPLNKSPFVLVGKGVMYDTGGLSLKPTANSMDSMKSDMAGAAAVVGTMVAAAKNKLPFHIIGLVPATENRPGGNAYVPGDVIRMHNGSSVEVLNTDAEGRLILADALSYAARFKPALVIDLATLTGAAVRAIGTRGIALMGTADKKIKKDLMAVGQIVYERLAELPFWDDFEDDIKSGIADLKNIGGINAGAITAGKFLEHFTSKDGKKAYPWLHLDIAGPAFLDKKDAYRLAGGTGVGIRLLYEFFRSQVK